MAMEALPPARKKFTGKPGGKGPRKSREDGPRGNSKYTPKLLGKAYFQRRRGCPFSGPKAPKIDYKDVRMLGKYLSDYGKILPRHITGVCAAKQRELALAIKRARMLALLPYTVKSEGVSERPARPPRSFEPREPRAAAAPAAAE